MTKHVILFLAANPSRSSGRALDDECAAIERELRMTSRRDDFAFHSKWAVTVDDMIRHFNELRPTIIHFSGDSAGDGSDARSGIHLQGDRDAAQLVTGRALMLMIKSAAASARVVVLNACYSEPQADAVRSVVDCVVGMAGAIGSAAARSFAVSFYGALGNHRSVGNAVDQAVAVLAAKGMPEEVLPRCVTRDGIDKYQVILDPVDGPGRAGPGRDAVPPPRQALAPRPAGHEAHPPVKNPDVREGTEFPATVVFVVIQGLQDCSDAPKVPNALRALNDAVRTIDPGAFVLSTLAGVIVVVPDTVAWNADDTFRALDQAAVGFALGVGVTHGTVEVVRDIDDAPNLIGPPINIAARLATSSDHPGMLIHESYAELVDGTLAATHWLHRSVRRSVAVTGKPQDPVFTCFPGPHRFAARPLQREEAYESRPAVLVAYDLPKFSAGDRAQLRKRFTRLAQVFQKLRQSASMQLATALLSPGGDGGVLVLEGVNHADAAALAVRLQALTEIESLDQDEAIAVEIRIGVHYGPVVHYVNARGSARPTGLAVFVADQLAGDVHARSRKGVILTRLLADALAGGSSERLTSEFERLPRLASGPAAGVERFVKAGQAPPMPSGQTPTPSPSPSPSPPRPRAPRATREDVLRALSRLLPGQFDEVLFSANVPTAHLSGPSAAQATRAIELIRYFEQRGQLDPLARIIEEIMNPS